MRRLKTDKWRVTNLENSCPLDLLNSKILLLAQPLLEKFANSPYQNNLFQISTNFETTKQCQKSHIPCNFIDELDTNFEIMDLIEVYKTLIDKNSLLCQ